MSSELEDRHTIYSEALSGDCLSNANIYFTAISLFADEFALEFL